jgi:hypothetical protein
MSDVTKISPGDGFDDGGDEVQQSRVIRGEKWGFSNAGTWVNAADEVISPELEVVAVQICRVLQKWIDKMPVAGTTTFLAPHDHPDVEQLNEECPRVEWAPDPGGNLKGPWQIQNIVYLVDLQTMSMATYCTHTIGGGICVGELKDTVKLMRKFRGDGAYPVVSLSSKYMATRFGGRMRPHFVIKRWMAFGPEGAALPSASPSSLPSPEPAAQSPLEQRVEAEIKTAVKPEPKGKGKGKDAGARTVAPLTLAEEMDDGLPENM